MVLFDLIVGFVIIYLGLIFLGWLADNGAVICGWLLGLGVFGVTTWGVGPDRQTAGYDGPHGYWRGCDSGVCCPSVCRLAGHQGV